MAHCGWRPGSRWLNVAGGPARGGSLWLEVTRAGSRCLRASWRQVGAVSGAVRGRPGFLSLSVSATRPVTVTVTGFWEQLQSGRAVLRWPSRADRSRRRSRPPAAAQRREIVSSSSSGAGRADHCRHTLGRGGDWQSLQLGRRQQPWCRPAAAGYIKSEQRQTGRLRY